MTHRPTRAAAILGALLLPCLAASAQVNRPLPGGRQPVVAPRTTAGSMTVVKPGAPPAGVQIQPTGPTGAIVRWQPASGATGYTVSRKLATAPFAVVAQLPATATSYTDAQLAPNLDVQYQVAASYADAGQGVASVGMRTPDGHPAGFQAAVTGPGTVRLTWQPMPNATSYWIAGTPDSRANVAATGTSHTITGVPAGTHTYALMARFALPGVGEWEANGNTMPSRQVVVPGAVAAASCSLQYERADNALAAVGRPDGDLGVETLTLTPGNAIVFNTDWKYEKRRGDANNHFGSHLRRARNTGNAKMIVTVREAINPIERVDRPDALYAGESSNYRADLVEVRCFPPPPTSTCTLRYERADNGFAAPGRPDGDLGEEHVTVGAGGTIAFNTSVQYEKLRGTDKVRYGSHLRRATNTGQRDVQIRMEALPGELSGILKGIFGAPASGVSGAAVRLLTGGSGLVTVPPGKQILTAGHLASVRCP